MFWYRRELEDVQVKYARLQADHVGCSRHREESTLKIAETSSQLQLCMYKFKLKLGKGRVENPGRIYLNCIIYLHTETNIFFLMVSNKSWLVCRRRMETAERDVEQLKTLITQLDSTREELVSSTPLILYSSLHEILFTKVWLATQYNCPLGLAVQKTFPPTSLNTLGVSSGDNVTSIFKVKGLLELDFFRTGV